MLFAAGACPRGSNTGDRHRRTAWRSQSPAPLPPQGARINRNAYKKASAATCKLPEDICTPLPGYSVASRLPGYAFGYAVASPLPPCLQFSSFHPPQDLVTIARSKTAEKRPKPGRAKPRPKREAAPGPPELRDPLNSCLFDLFDLVPSCQPIAARRAGHDADKCRQMKKDAERCTWQPPDNRRSRRPPRASLGPPRGRRRLPGQLG